MENVALRPRAKITEEDSSSVNKSSWVVELEALLKEEKTCDGSSPVVFSVAKAFSGSEQEYYIPRFVSVGPYHFEKVELRSMEPHKTEAVLRMQHRIGRSMQSIVENEIVPMDKSVREFYDKEFSYSAIDFAWMLTKDSCFLFEFILNFLRTHMGKQDFHKDCVVEGRYDAVLSASPMNPTWKNIFYDLSLFENQIPLSVLQRLLGIAYSESKAEMILVDILGKVASLYSNMVFRCSMEQQFEKKESRHFLEVLYYRHVGWNLAAYKRDAHSDKYRQLWHFGSSKSIFTRCCPRWMRGRGDEHQVSAFEVKLPSAADLKKKGVKLCADTSENHGCIQRIRFEEETSTLYLPEVRIDHLGHALLRNFIALELTSEKYQPSPITAFAFFMNELLDSEEDVAVLREANIIKNFFGSNKEAAECFNAITRSYPVCVGCKPIDKARVGLHKYLGRKYKILWREFLSIYFAKPWLVVGFMIAGLVLLMTSLQVFCRFYTCSR